MPYSGFVPDKTMAVNLTYFSGMNYFLGTFDVDNYQRWWKSKPLPVRDIKLAMSSYGAINHICLALLDNGDWGIFRSIDFGQTWSLVYQSQDEIYTIFKIEEGWLVFNAADGFYESVNGGVDWVKIADLPGANSNKIAICEAGWSDVYGDGPEEPATDRVFTTFFITDGEFVWRSQDICRTWAKVLTIANQFESNIFPKQSTFEIPVGSGGIGHNSPGFGITDPYPFDSFSNPPAIGGYNGYVLVGAGRYIVWSSDGGLTWARLDKHSNSDGDAISSSALDGMLYKREVHSGGNSKRGTIHEHPHSNFGTWTQHWNAWMPDWPDVGFTDFPNPTYMPWDFRIVEIRFASAQRLVRYPFDVNFLVKTVDLGQSDVSVTNFLRKTISITSPTGADEYIYFAEAERFYSTPANWVRVDMVLISGRSGSPSAYTETIRKHLTLVWDRAPNPGECRIFTGSDNEKPHIQFSTEDIPNWTSLLKTNISLNIAINPINLKNRIFVSQDLTEPLEWSYGKLLAQGWQEYVDGWLITHPPQYAINLTRPPHYIRRGWRISTGSGYYKAGLDLAAYNSALFYYYNYPSYAQASYIPGPIWWLFNWLFFNVLNTTATEGFAAFAINESLVTASDKISNIMFAAQNEYVPDPDGMGGTVVQKLMSSTDGGVTWTKTNISDLSLYPGAAEALDAAANDLVAEEAEKQNAAVVFKSESFGSMSWNGNYCSNAWRFRLDHFHRFFSFDIKPNFGPETVLIPQNIAATLGYHNEYPFSLDAMIERREQVPINIEVGLLERPSKIVGLRAINFEQLSYFIMLGGIIQERQEEPFLITAICSGRVRKGIMISAYMETNVLFPIDITVNLVLSHIDELVAEMEGIIPQWWDQIGPRRPLKPYDSKLEKK